MLVLVKFSKNPKRGEKAHKTFPLEIPFILTCFHNTFTSKSLYKKKCYRMDKQIFFSSHQVFLRLLILMVQIYKAYL